MLLVAVGAHGNPLAVFDSGVPAQGSRIAQNVHGNLDNLRDFVRAGVEPVGVRDGSHEDLDDEVGPRDVVVEASQDRYVVPGDAHLLFGLTTGGVFEIRVFWVAGAAGERHLSLMVLNRHGSLVQQHAELAVLGVQQYHYCRRHQAFSGGSNQLAIGQRVAD